MENRKLLRVVLGIACAVGLLVIFLGQHVDIASLFFKRGDRYTHFLINRVVRFFLNDALSIGLIYSLFGERKYVIFSVYVQVAGFILFMCPYLVIKFYYPRYNGPLLSFLHRIILNPTILLLLIPAFYYQKKVAVR